MQIHQNTHAEKMDRIFGMLYVTSVKTSGLRILWLYQPSSTTCAFNRYPHENELFLSDHCNCERPPIPFAEVTEKVSVAFYGNPKSKAAFFVRQHFNQPVFTTLHDEHFRCNCDRDEPLIRYAAGDTVIVVRSGGVKPVLEPMILVESAQSTGQHVTARCLKRRQRDFGDAEAEPNELVLTSVVEEIPLNNVERRCHIRYYSIADREQKLIPAPYSRAGRSDAWFISSEEVRGSQSLLPLRKSHLGVLNEGFDPLEPPKHSQMSGMGIFCGGGSFDRGIEEGGAVKMKWAVDYELHAIQQVTQLLKKSPSILIDEIVHTELILTIQETPRDYSMDLSMTTLQRLLKETRMSPKEEMWMF